jgi:hypothetical protein
LQIGVKVASASRLPFLNIEGATAARQSDALPQRSPTAATIGDLTAADQLWLGGGHIDQ